MNDEEKGEIVAREEDSTEKTTDNQAKSNIEGRKMIEEYKAEGGIKGDVAILIEQVDSGKITRQDVDVDDLLDEFLYTVFLNYGTTPPSEGIKENTHHNYFNIQDIILQMKKEFKIDTDELLRVMTFCFYKNDIYLKSESNIKKLKRQEVIKSGGPLGIPDIEETACFIESMHDIFGDKKESGIIYITLGNDSSINVIVQRVSYKILLKQNKNIHEMEASVYNLQKELAESQEKLKGLQNKIEDSQKLLNNSHEEQELLQKKLEDYNKSIITIVSLIVGIVPLLTTNLQMLSAQMSLDKLFAVNGTLMLVIGVMFFLINKVVNGDEDKAKKPWFLGFLGIGILLIIISICLLLFKEPMQFYHVQVFKNIDSYKQK